MPNALLRGEQRNTEPAPYHLNHLNQRIVKCHALRIPLEQFVSNMPRHHTNPLITNVLREFGLDLRIY